MSRRQRTHQRLQLGPYTFLKMPLVQRWTAAVPWASAAWPVSAFDQPLLWPHRASAALMNWLRQTSSPPLHTHPLH